MNNRWIVNIFVMQFTKWLIIWGLTRWAKRLVKE